MGSAAKEAHRGRLQVQGDDMPKPEPSCPWAQATPKTAPSALEGLASLEGCCSNSQRSRRDRGFLEARRFISNAHKDGGVQHPVSESFPRNKRHRPKDVPNARVDVEVHLGLAFV